MKLSNRIQNMNLSPIRKLSGDAQKTKDKGIKVFNLNIGQPDLNTPNKFLNAINDYNLNTLEYTTSEGLSSLRESISNYYKHYNINFNKDEILVTNGASEAILFSLLAICDIDDNILIPEPFYTNYLNFAKSANINVRGFKTDSDNGYHLPHYQKITEKIDNKTKAILLSNPCNPTGTVYTKEEIDIIKRIALSNDLWIIADEVYRDFIYDTDEFISFATLEDISDRVILIDSASKRFSACGARIGCLASKNKDLLNEILKLCQTRLCVPTLEQIGAKELYNLNPTYLETDRIEYKKRRDTLFKEMSSIPNCICRKPEGAFYLMITLPNIDTEDFAKWLINDFNYNNETVLICPANGFYLTEGAGLNEIRLSYVINENDLISSAKILKHGLTEYKKLKNIE